MSLQILHIPTATAVAAASTQDTQVSALISAWAGANVTVRAMSGSTLLATLSHAPWSINSGVTPRRLVLGARLARTFVAQGTPDKLVFRSGSTDIFSVSAGVGAGSDFNFVTNISNLALERIETGLVITAKATLPSVTPPVSIRLIGPTSGTNGIPATFTAQLNAPATSPVTVVPSGSGATFSTPGVIPVGSSSTTFTATRSGTGTTAVAISSSPVLTPLDSPINFSTTAPVVSTPAASSGGDAAFNLSSIAGSTNEPFMLGMGLARSQFPSGTGIVARGTGLLGYQVDVKATWPDNSAKVVVVTGRATLGAGASSVVSLKPGAATTGAALTEADLLASGVDATLQFAGGPVMTLSSLINTAAVSNSSGLSTNGRVRQIVSGPQMSSWLYACRLSSTNAHVIGWMEVQFFGGTKVNILPWVENGWSRINSCAGQAGTLVFTMGGTTRFSQADVHLANHCRVVAQDIAGCGHWSGTAPDLYGVEDANYLQSTYLVPAYFPDTTTNTTGLNNLSQIYSPTIYGQLVTSPRDTGGNGTNNGDFDAGMGNAGYHLGIGLLPGWEAYFLSSNGDKRAYHASIANAMGYGRYGVHFRDELTLRPINPTDIPNKTLNQNDSGMHGISGIGANQFGTAECLPVPTGYDAGGGVTLKPETWMATHHPSAGFLAYLLTGREFFLELNQFVAGTCFLRQNNVHRNYALGLQLTHQETTRGAAWALRSIFQAAAISNDGTALKTGFATIAANNINDYHTQYVATPSGAFGTPRPYSNFQVGSGNYRVNAWEVDFSVACWGYGIHLAPVTGVDADKLAAYFQWHGQWPVARLGALGDANAFGFNCAARENSIAIAPAPVGNELSCWNTNTGWYANPGAMFQATLGMSNAGNTVNTIGAFDGNNGYFPDATSYWGNYQLSLLYAVEHGVPGALAGYKRMVGASNWSSFEAAGVNAPGYAHRPRNVYQWGMGTTTGSLVGDLWTPGRDAQGRVTKASWASVPAGRWIEVANTRIDGLTPKIVAENLGWVSATLWGTTPANSIFQSWSGMSLDAARGRLHFMGGGHSDGYNNGLYRFDLNKMAWGIECMPSNRSVMSSAYLNNGSSSLDPDSRAVTDANFNANNPSGTTLGVIAPVLNGPFWDEVFTDNTKPTARHTYEGMDYAENLGSGGSVIMHAKRLWKYDLASGKWDYKRLVMDKAYSAVATPAAAGVTMVHSVEAGLGIWDEVNRKMLCSASGSSGNQIGFGAYVLDWDTQTWSLWNPAPYGVNYGDAAHTRYGRTVASLKPPVSDQTVYQGNYWVYNMDSATITVSGVPQLAGGLSLADFQPGAAFYDGAAAVYIPSLNRYWMCTRKSDSTMFWVQWDPTTTPWTLSPLTFANAQPVTTRLILGRIKWIEELKAVVVFDHCFANAFVYRF